MGQRIALGLVFGILLATLGLAPSLASAQDEVLVLIVDAGPTRINLTALSTSISRSVGREVVRMTDDRAPTARGRLTIAFSPPNRWVLRYEAGGQVAWVSDRITRPGRLRNRLAELSSNVVRIVDGDRAQARRRERRASRRAAGAGRTTGTTTSWDDEVIQALQDEIIDPFADTPRRERRDPVTVLWSEVVDPFATGGSRTQVGEVWTEVLDPWSTEVHRRRR